MKCKCSTLSAVHALRWAFVDARKQNSSNLFYSFVASFFPLSMFFLPTVKMWLLWYLIFFLTSWMLLLWGSFSFIIRQAGSCCRLDFLCPQTASSLFHKLQIFYPLLSKITFHILSNLFLCGSLIPSNAIFSSFI